MVDASSRARFDWYWAGGVGREARCEVVDRLTGERRLFRRASHARSFYRELKATFGARLPEGGSATGARRGVGRG